MKRYFVSRCDEGGTLFDSDNNPIDHTWDVIDRETGFSVDNLDSRRAARVSCAELNAKHESQQKG